MELEGFDDGDEFFGIFGVGGIACGLESVRPILVIGSRQLQKMAISVALQEFGMGAEAKPRRIEDLKKVVGRVVGVFGAAAGCAFFAALQSEMVVFKLGEIAIARVAFEQGLGEGNGGGNAV